MKIKEGFSLKEVAGKTIIVASGERALNFNKIIHINYSGKLLFEALSVGKSEEELVKILLDTYDVNEAVARKDVKIFIQMLQMNDIV